MRGFEIARIAKEELTGLMGLEPDTVSGMHHDDEGWHVTVEMIELRRIPPSSDVLDSYDVLLDDDGEILSYERVRRYQRGGVLEPISADKHAGSA
jgi:hypothetical protein